jgi:hypothetical protein
MRAAVDRSMSPRPGAQEFEMTLRGEATGTATGTHPGRRRASSAAFARLLVASATVAEYQEKSLGSQPSLTDPLQRARQPEHHAPSPTQRSHEFRIGLPSQRLSGPIVGPWCGTPRDDLGGNNTAGENHRAVARTSSCTMGTAP